MNIETFNQTFPVGSEIRYRTKPNSEFSEYTVSSPAIEVNGLPIAFVAELANFILIDARLIDGLKGNSK